MTLILCCAGSAETAGHHRYWRVGEPDPDQAAQIARDAIGADVARAVTSVPAHVLPEFQIAPGVITELVLETKQVAGPFQIPISETQIDMGGAKGEITFDIVVPEDGVSCVEGCYRIDGGNWQVYFLIRRGKEGRFTLDAMPCFRAAFAESAELFPIVGLSIRKS